MLVPLSPIRGYVCRYCTLLPHILQHGASILLIRFHFGRLVQKQAEILIDSLMAAAIAQVRGIRVVSGGSPCGVDLPGLRRAVMAAQPDYRNTQITDPRADPSTAAFETEYRAALELDGEASQRKRDRTPGELFPEQRVLYDPSLQITSSKAESIAEEQFGKRQKL